MSLDINVKDLATKCDELYLAFRDTAYKDDFEWIDHLELVTDKSLITQLDETLAEELRNCNTTHTHMATPEPISWEDIDRFRISGTGKHLYDELDLDSYLEILAEKRGDITSDRLRQRSVSIQYTRSGNFDSLWSVYQCLVSEQRVDDRLLVLIEGRWFRISESLVEQVDKFDDGLPTSVPFLTDPHANETEPAYNARMAREHLAHRSDDYGYILLMNSPNRILKPALKDSSINGNRTTERQVVVDSEPF